MNVVDAVNATQASTFLEARFGSAVSAATPIAEGEWSKAFGFERAGTLYVIRFSAIEEDFAKDRLAAHYASPELPIPQIDEIGDAFGGFYAISRRAPGGYLDVLGGAQLRATLPSFFAMLDAARRVDLSASKGYGGWDANGAASHSSWRAALLDIGHDQPEDRVHGWRERLASSSIGCGPFDQALEQLRSLVDACPEDRHLIHSDLLHFNVLVTGDRISAVIDWGCAMYGDFLYDVAWFAFYWPWFPAWRDIDFLDEVARHYDAIGIRVPDMDTRLRCYQVHVGLGDQIWNAFKGNWAAIEAGARRTLEVARAAA